MSTPNVTNTSGGKISGQIALTFEATVSLAIDDPVEISGDYQVIKAAGTNSCVGYVDVANAKRVGGNFPVAVVPGTVTVEARGTSVRTLKAGTTITAGQKVGPGSDGLLHPAGGGVATIGTALMGASTGNLCDVLVGAV
jgi:hypothetical protein